MSNQSEQTIVVLGATGLQGGGVVRHLLARTHYKVVGVTRNTSSEFSKALLSTHTRRGSRFSLCQADVHDLKSLVKAFEGAHGVFALTQYLAPVLTDEDLRSELTTGNNIIDAAKTTGVKHLVYSGLPSPSAASDGRWTSIGSFEYKSQVEKSALDKLGPSIFTAIHPGLFFDNLHRPQYARKAPDGTLEFHAPFDKNKLLGWSDPAFDVGLFASEIFRLGPSVTGGHTYPVQCEPICVREMGETYTRIRGTPVRYLPTSIADWGEDTAINRGPGLRQDVEDMVAFLQWTPYETGSADYGSMAKEEYQKRMEELGHSVKASSFEEWLKRSGYEPAQW